MTIPGYEVYAIRYAERDGRRPAHFVGGDPHDAPMPMDYFVWLARNAERTIVVDTGFSAATAARRGRRFLRSAREGLALLGVRGAEVRDVVITHMHNDHAGTRFPTFPGRPFTSRTRKWRTSPAAACGTRCCSVPTRSTT